MVHRIDPEVFIARRLRYWSRDVADGIPTRSFVGSNAAGKRVHDVGGGKGRGSNRARARRTAAAATADADRAGAIGPPSDDVHEYFFTTNEYFFQYLPRENATDVAARPRFVISASNRHSLFFFVLQVALVVIFR